jgi:hypothetical protein
VEGMPTRLLGDTEQEEAVRRARRVRNKCHYHLVHLTLDLALADVLPFLQIEAAD